MKSEKITPDQLPEVIREWRERKDTRLALQKQAAIIEKQEKLLKGRIMEALREQGKDTEGLVVDGRVTGVSPGVAFRISNWRELKKYVIDNDAFDLLSFALSKSGVKDRGELPPGVEVVETLSIYDRKAE